MNLRVLSEKLHWKMISLSCLGLLERSQSEWSSGLSPSAAEISFNMDLRDMRILVSVSRKVTSLWRGAPPFVFVNV